MPCCVGVYHNVDIATRKVLIFLFPVDCGKAVWARTFRWQSLVALKFDVFIILAVKGVKSAPE